MECKEGMVDVRVYVDVQVQVDIDGNSMTWNEGRIDVRGFHRGLR